MAKQKTSPERLGVRLPAGSLDRIRKVIGLPTDQKTGQNIYGSALRRWILERLATEEAGGPSRPNAPTDTSENWLERAKALLDNPLTQERFKSRILMSEDDARRATNRQRNETFLTSSAA